MRKLNMDVINSKPSTNISTEESLKDVEPYYVEEETDWLELARDCGQIAKEIGLTKERSKRTIAKRQEKY